MRDILLALLFLVSMHSFAQEHFDPKTFRAEIQEMSPMKYPSRQVSYGYSLELRNDSAFVYLPYMGEVYMPTFDNQGINFQCPYTGMSIRKNKKGTATLVTFSIHQGTVGYTFKATAYNNGRFYLDMMPSNAQSCSYMGYLKEKE